MFANFFYCEPKSIPFKFFWLSLPFILPPRLPLKLSLRLLLKDSLRLPLKLFNFKTFFLSQWGFIFSVSEWSAISITLQNLSGDYVLYKTCYKSEDTTFFWCVILFYVVILNRLDTGVKFLYFDVLSKKL